MLKLLADEDFNNDIVRGLRRRRSNIDLLCVQDTPVAGQLDTAVLEWAAHEGRVLLPHDVNTLLLCAYERVVMGLAMTGVAALSQSVPVGVAIDEVLLVAECSEPHDWDNQVRYLPL